MPFTRGHSLCFSVGSGLPRRNDGDDWTMAKTMEELAALAGKLTALPTAQKLTMAVMLLQAGKTDVAESVITAALEDLLAARLLGIKRVPLVSRR
jgi:hypothetical protein